METILTKSDDSQISEFKLRTLAGLCQYCGMARKYQDTALCEQCFKEEDGLDLSPEQANEYLHSMAGLFLAFAEKRADPIASATGGALPVDTNHGDLTLGVSNT